MPSVRSQFVFVTMWLLATPAILYRAATDTLAPAVAVCADYDWNNQSDQPDWLVEPAGFAACVVDVATGGDTY